MKDSYKENIHSIKSILSSYILFTTITGTTKIKVIFTILNLLLTLRKLQFQNIDYSLTYSKIIYIY